MLSREDLLGKIEDVVFELFGLGRCENLCEEGPSGIGLIFDGLEKILGREIGVDAYIDVRVSNYFVHRLIYWP